MLKTYQAPIPVHASNLDTLVNFIDNIKYEFENIEVRFQAEASLFSDTNSVLALMPVRVFFDVGQMLEACAAGYRPVDWEIEGRKNGLYQMVFFCRPVHFEDLVGLPNT